MNHILECLCSVKVFAGMIKYGGTVSELKGKTVKNVT